MVLKYKKDDAWKLAYCKYRLLLLSQGFLCTLETRRLPWNKMAAEKVHDTAGVIKTVPSEWIFSSALSLYPTEHR